MVVVGWFDFGRGDVVDGELASGVFIVGEFVGKYWKGGYLVW